jgi:hypothetical protein
MAGDFTDFSFPENFPPAELPFERGVIPFSELNQVDAARVEQTPGMYRFSPDETYVPEEFVFRSDLAERVNDALNHLSKHYRSVVELRFGVGGQEKHTYKEAAEALGLSQDRIRFDQVTALKHLRVTVAEHPRDTLEFTGETLQNDGLETFQPDSRFVFFKGSPPPRPSHMAEKDRYAIAWENHVRDKRR